MKIHTLLAISAIALSSCTTVVKEPAATTTTTHTESAVTRTPTTTGTDSDAPGIERRLLKIQLGAAKKRPVPFHALLRVIGNGGVADYARVV